MKKTMKTKRSLHRRTRRSLVRLLCTGFVLLSTFQAMAQEIKTKTPEMAVIGRIAEPAVKKPDAPQTFTKSEIELMKAQLMAQQEQIEQLRKKLEEQAKLLDHLLQKRASESSTPAAATPLPGPDRVGILRPETLPADPLERNSQVAKANEGKPSPLNFRIGTAHITPFGFMDFTAVIRDRNVGSSIGTNFGAIPFSNTVFGNLREYRFSAQNSRLGLRVDAKVRGFDLLGYLETDFQGIVPGNVAVTSNSDTLRLRLFWVDLRKGKHELLAGQSWS